MELDQGADGRPAVDVADLDGLVGRTVGTSAWQVIDQDMIDRFADLTGDHQFIHVDPERARQTPFGTTIAHGFLSLSIMGGLATVLLPRINGERMGINYGFDKLRFVAPVPSGTRVRTVLTLKGVDTATTGQVDMLYDALLEAEGADKPAIVAQWRTRSYLG